MTLGTVLSRVTGLARLAAVTAALGIVESGRLTDAYNYANTAPNILYELVLGGVLTSVFVPVFVELLDKEGRERAWEVGSAIINLVLIVLTAIAVVGIVLAPLAARFYAARVGGSQALFESTMTFLLRLFIPQIIFYGLIAVTSGLLNAHKRFGAPMYTPILNNLAVIAVFVAWHEAYGAVGDLKQVSDTQLLVIGLGTTAGVVLQAIAQLPFLRGLGHYRPTLSLRHPSIRRMASLSVFVIGYVVVNQIGYLMVQFLAEADTGAYSAYVSGFIFFMLPHGLFAVSVITALLPGMSEDATRRRWEDFRARLSTGVRATFLLILPAAIGYGVLGEPIVRLLLDNGVMTTRSVDLIVGALRFFVLGLVQFSLFQLLLRAFYAMQDTKTPFLINLAAVAVNIAVNIPLSALFGGRGLAAGLSIAYTCGVILQARALARRIGGLDGPRILRNCARITLAGAGMGVLVLIAQAILARLVDHSLTGELILVLVPVATGAVAYLGLAMLLGVEELGLVRGILSRRIARG
ncbi:N/A [soil metagenome]